MNMTKDELRKFVEELRDVDRSEYREPAYRERMAIASRLEAILNEETEP